MAYIGNSAAIPADGSVTTAKLATGLNINHATGSSSTPSATFLGSTTTGLFSPAADVVGITTAGTERLRITNLGEIGLGGANYGTSGQVLTSNGSGNAPTWQTTSGTPITFRLTSDGSAIAGTQTNVFSSSLNLAASSVYNIEIFLYLLKDATAGGLATYVTLNSAPIAMAAQQFDSFSAGGIRAGTSTGATSITISNYNISLTSNVNYMGLIKTQVVTNLATTFNCQVAVSAGNITPKAGSFYTATKIP